MFKISLSFDKSYMFKISLSFDRVICSRSVYPLIELYVQDQFILW